GRFHKLSTNPSHPGGKAKPLSGKGKSGFSTESPAPTTFTATSINREALLRSLLKKKTTRARSAQANKKEEKDIENHLRQDPFERRHRRRLPRRDPPFHHPRPGRHPAES